jgi:hypothetical protein
MHDDQQTEGEWCTKIAGSPQQLDVSVYSEAYENCALRREEYASSDSHEGLEASIEGQSRGNNKQHCVTTAGPLFGVIAAGNAAVAHTCITCPWPISRQPETGR